MKLTRYLSLFLLTTSLLGIPALTAAQFGTVTPFAGTSTGDLISAITNIVNALLALAALIAAIVIVFSGVTALNAGSDEDVAARAKNTILYAVIGLVVIALSAVIVNFIINAIP